MNIVIYGAQGVALAAARAIKYLIPSKELLGFIVTEFGNNAKVLMGLPVMELQQFVAKHLGEDFTEFQIYIAAPDSVIPEIESSLDAVGLINHRALDSMTWANLQESFYLKSGKLKTIAELMGENYQEDFTPETRVYMTRFNKDKELIGEYQFPSYMIQIQAGAANTNDRVADIIDCDGDNISRKNANYSELTSLYWLWKNDIMIDEERANHYFGLAHYRRYLMLSNMNLVAMEVNNIDVVLPYPLLYEPDIHEHHKRYLSDEEWRATLQALVELHPDYATSYSEILRQDTLYNYNIIIAKGDALADYCEWLFPILFRIEELVDPEGNRNPNRYIGYIAETLETLYFIYNRDKLKIAHTGCRFLV